ncbi:TPA: glycosyltransferase [Proteus mirabilis]|uniref:Gt1 n=3 Tax=Proteus mirabilis TaxID=584 RepID=A0A385JMD5_PROMI|nr:gt1 [Proteus mirabilis]ELA7862022.1 glycosyltransferase [Proteus mirabilis]HCD1088056.1 glycosyltransferase [Proteus mirabilis]HEI9725362.1 glycosyltransferase [Proteus mirabilis]HEJ9592089.1 glycosyltransferase [Proteus mirabilis]
MIKKPKIIHIITGLNNGGAEGVLYRLCKYDLANDHVVISLTTDGKYGSMLRDINVNVICLHLKSFSSTLPSLIKLYKIIKKEKPYIVQTWMYHADLIGGIIAKLAGVKKIYWNIRQTNLIKGKSKKTTILIAKICSKFSFFIPCKIICCASEAKKTHIDLGYKGKDMVIIPNGFDFSQYKKSHNDEIKKQLGIPQNSICIGMVARFDPQKNHLLLLDAFTRIYKNKNIKLILIGSNITNNNKILVEYIKNKNIEKETILLGERKDIPDMMSLLDIHILSSSFGEGFPNVLVEAMASGTPCIATDVGDSRLIISEYGWIIPPNNLNKLISALNSALSIKELDNKKWEDICVACKKHVISNYDIEKMVDAYNSTWFEK